MGDIKSTLDLVMAKTRHLSLSDEERQLQQTEDINRKLNGLIKKHLDQGLKIDRFRDEWQQLKKSAGDSGDRLLRTALVDNIDFNQDMGGLFGLMAGLDGLDPAPFQTLYQSYRTEQADAAKQLQDRLARELAEKNGISGSAVVPNIEKRSAWTETQSALDQKYGNLLGQARRLFGAG